MNRSLSMAPSFAGALALCGAATHAAAQPAAPPSTPGAQNAARGGRLYDPATVETVRRAIVRVEQVAGKGRGQSPGVHVSLKTESGEIAVHLGPAWYLDKQGVSFKAGDRIEARGSRITFDGKPAIIAAQVTTGGHTLALRNAAGVPVWSRQGRTAP